MKSINRKDFLRNVGLMGIGLATAPMWAKDLMNEPSNDDLLKSGDCTSIPEETAGPYPVPSSVSTSTLVRSDITEGTQTGIPLSLTITIINVDNDCLPVSGLRVDIWHCNIRGYYSAYDDQPGIDGSVDNAGTTWLRGIQYTDSNGQVNFTTIYPGWYTPRATHIHVQVFDASNNLITTTQMAFPDAINTTVNTYYATSGTNSFTNTNDMVFSDSYTDQLMTVTGNTTDGYVATKEIAINAGTSGLQEIELETGGQFGQLTVYPNPMSDLATVSFVLIQASTVKILVSDAAGRVLKTLDQGQLTSGKQICAVDLTGLAAGTYHYQLVVSNETGTFKQTKKLVKE